MKVGDLFYTSWGYDQTNYDFIVIVEMSPTGKTAKCRRTACDTVESKGQCNEQRPVNKPFGETFRLKVRGDDLIGSYPYMSDGKGSRRRGSFWPQKGNETHAETDTQYGH